MNIFPEDIDRKSIEEIKAYQEEQLKELLGYVGKNSKFYSELFKEHNIDIKQIKSLDDLQKYLLLQKMICTNKTMILFVLTNVRLLII